MRFAPQSKPMSGDARSVASFVALGGEGSAHAFLSSVILVCVGASPPSICEEPSSALFYFLSISFPFLSFSFKQCRRSAVALRSECSRIGCRAGRLLCGCLPIEGAGVACPVFDFLLPESDAVRGCCYMVASSDEVGVEGVSCSRSFAAGGCRVEALLSVPSDGVEAAGCAGQRGVWNACPIVGLLVDAVLAVGVFYAMVGCWARKSACTTFRSAGVRAGRLCGWQRGTACGGCGLLPFGLAALRLSFFRSAVFPYPVPGSSLSARLPSRCRHKKSGKRTGRFPLWCSVLRSRLRSVFRLPR